MNNSDLLPYLFIIRTSRFPLSSVVDTDPDSLISMFLGFPDPHPDPYRPTFCNLIFTGFAVRSIEVFIFNSSVQSCTLKILEILQIGH
jgi:hypothetical protein